MSLVIRDATAADYDVYARLHPALEVPYPILTAAQFAERMLPNIILVCDGTQPIGYALWVIYGVTAHISQIVVDPNARGRGAGHLLMQEVRRLASAKGCTRWYLNVKAENAVAVRLYERSGLTIEQRGWAMVAEWNDLRGLPGATTTVPFDPPEDEVARFGRQHTLDPERIALLRSRPGHVFVALQDHAGLCALAVFNPNLPGIYPIAVSRPEHARSLFDLLAPCAPAPHVNIFTEGNGALAEALKMAGAKLDFEIFRMGASLSL
jgi:GNAT superfamily N-acetyltransferase